MAEIDGSHASAPERSGYYPVTEFHGDKEEGFALGTLIKGKSGQFVEENTCSAVWASSAPLGELVQVSLGRPGFGVKKGFGNRAFHIYVPVIVRTDSFFGAFRAPIKMLNFVPRVKG